MRVQCALYWRIPEDESPLRTIQGIPKNESPLRTIQGIPKNESPQRNIQENTWRWESNAHYTGEYLKMRVHCALYRRIPKDENPQRNIQENTWRWESNAHYTGEYLKMRVQCALYWRIREDGFKSWGFVLTALTKSKTHHMRVFQSSKNSYYVADTVYSVRHDRKIHA
jgi:hypothetical protein